METLPPDLFVLISCYLLASSFSSQLYQIAGKLHNTPRKWPKTRQLAHNPFLLIPIPGKQLSIFGKLPRPKRVRRKTSATLRGNKRISVSFFSYKEGGKIMVSLPDASRLCRRGQWPRICCKTDAADGGQFLKILLLSCSCLERV